MEPHEIQEYIDSRTVAPDSDGRSAKKRQSFEAVCSRVKQAFFSEWDSQENAKSILDMQKKAIIGYERETAYFKDKISMFLREMSAEHTKYPHWYENLVDAIYQENWGMAGISEWFSVRYAQSSSAKIIGNRIYFLESGRMVLKPQTMSSERKQQLILAFLLANPESRADKAYHEIYLLDGTRVTIYEAPMAKKEQGAIVFRRYIIPILSFEEQANRGTIPEKSIPLFQAMVRIGFNVVFLGAVRTAKTTFLTTWQSYEDPVLEGVMVETDPEIPLHKINPDAPVLQLLADGQELLRISKSLLRSDADYFILAEARDGIALSTAVKIAAKGTKRMKMTFHSGDPAQFPTEAADEIIQITGGDAKRMTQRVAGSFDYVFHFIQLADKRQKRLKSIYEMCVDKDGEVVMEPMCEYDVRTDAWVFYERMKEVHCTYAQDADPTAYEQMKNILCELAAASPVKSMSAQKLAEVNT